MRWFAERAGGGRLLILRASGGSDLQEYFYEEIGGVSAARTLVFTARSAAFDPEVAALIDRADAVFIAGGDQARYIRFWKDTPVQQLLTAHVQSGKPIGGTSAGLAILVAGPTAHWMMAASTACRRWRIRSARPSPWNRTFCRCPGCGMC
jgi:Cyanophycinase and related exopeptidases